MSEEQQQTEQTQQSDSLITDTKEMDFALGRPDGFPEEFWDTEKNTPYVDKLYNSYSQEKKRAEGLRAKLSRGEFEGKAPEDIKEYVLELSDELKPLVPEDDRIFNAARNAAKQAGLPKEAFAKFMQPVIEELAKAKAEMETPPSEEEIAVNRAAEIEKLGPSGPKIVGAVGAFIAQMERGGTFSAEEARVAREMASSADAVRVLNKLRMMSGDRDQVPYDVPVDSKASRSDIESKMAQAMVTGNEAEYNKYSAMLARMN